MHPRYLRSEYRDHRETGTQSAIVHKAYGNALWMLVNVNEKVSQALMNF